MTKRISFNERDAEHIYEWLEMYWRGEQRFGGCYSCRSIGRRLERFIGRKAVRRTRKAVKDHPRG